MLLPAVTARWAPTLGHVEGSAPAEVELVHDGDTTWRFDIGFLTSSWTCIFGRGCEGILPERAAHLGQGCCSVGAALDGDDGPTVAARTTWLEPGRFQHHAVAATGGIFADDTRRNTRVVDGACIFLNRPGFEGGAGCALHLAALDAGESPVDWKPSVCWQLPVKVDWEPREDGGEVATVRGWTRRDWGEIGTTMAWCCTEEPEAHVGDRPVVDAMADELVAIVGQAVHVELRRRLGR